VRSDGDRDVTEFLAAMIARVALPHVQSPWPESIGLGFPFAMAGAAGVLVSMIQPEASQADRDRAIRLGNPLGLSPWRRLLRALAHLSGSFRQMKRFVGDHFLAPEIAGVIGGVFVGLTQASVGVTYLVALLLLVVVLVLGLGREKRAAADRTR
jgi:hypothetical protein